MSHQLVKSCHGSLLQILSGSLSSQNGVSYVLSRVISEKDVHSDAAVMGLHDTTEQAGWEAYRVCFSAANKSPAKRGAHTMSKGGLTVRQLNAPL